MGLWHWNGFLQQINIHDQVELANLVTELDKKGVFIMLSNSNTPFIHELYKPFNINTISTSRSINCKGDKRGKEPNEVLITNY